MLLLQLQVKKEAKTHGGAVTSNIPWALQVNEKIIIILYAKTYCATQRQKIISFDLVMQHNKQHIL